MSDTASFRPADATHGTFKRSRESDNDDDAPSSKWIHHHHSEDNESMGTHSEDIDHDVDYDNDGDSDTGQSVGNHQDLQDRTGNHFITIDSDSTTDSDASSASDSASDHEDETILEFCKRKGYVPHDVVVPRSKQLAPFLALKPLRELSANPLSKAHPFKLTAKRTYRWISLLTYVGGVVAPTPCAKCAKNGLWTECVVAPREEMAATMRGSCAGCIYSHHPETCSMSHGFPKTQTPGSNVASKSNAASLNALPAGNQANSRAGPSRGAAPAPIARADLRRKLQETDDRISAVRTRRVKAKKLFNDLLAQIRTSAELDTTQLDSRLATAAARCGRLLAERFSLTRRRAILTSRLSNFP